MSEDESVSKSQDIIIAIAKGLVDSAEESLPDPEILIEALETNSYIQLTRDTAQFLGVLFRKEIPEEPEEISNLEKDELIFFTMRVNFFERLRHPVATDDQLNAMHARVQELWGEHPTEPLGRWVEWSIWTNIHRRSQGIPIGELVAGSRTATDVFESWIERHDDREEQRKLRKVTNYDRYDTPEEVPPGIRRLVMSPFLHDDTAEVVVEIDDNDKVVEEANTDTQERD